jgi:cytochrome c oxidase subunit 4
MPEPITEVDPSTADLVPVDESLVPAVAGGGALVNPPSRHAHPEPRQYVLIAVVLVVITGFEVATSYLEGNVNSNLIIAALGVFAAIKFFLVVAWFMHLRTDSKILRRFFLIGLCAAPILYLVVLSVLHVFSPSL